MCNIGGGTLNLKLEEYKRNIKNKRIAVLGIGVSNTPLIKYLVKIGVDITAFDKSERDKLGTTIMELEDLGVKFSLGDNYLSELKDFDVVFRTPGMRFDIPELLKEKERGALITSEMEVFIDLCPAKIFAVTGSDGKTTTTTLIYKILTEQGYKCWLGGNIGTPLLSKIDEIEESDKVIIELSSFQLQTFSKSPDIAIITNLSPNHLDVHKSMDEYTEAKKNIFKFQTRAGKLILNYDNEITKGFTNEAKGEVVYFSRVNSLKLGVVVEDGKLVYKDETNKIEFFAEEDIIIPGVHNTENYLAAIAAVIDYVKPETIKKVATTFKGVEHRIELVRELNGIKFYNDSIASSPTRTIAGLNSFKQKVILITGGYDKKLPFDEMGPAIIEKVKCLILFGQTALKIEKVLENEIKKTDKASLIPVYKCDTLEETVNKAYSLAVRGDIIILSPASASFDMFRNFEERGNIFKDIVKNLY